MGFAVCKHSVILKNVRINVPRGWLDGRGLVVVRNWRVEGGLVFGWGESGGRVFGWAGRFAAVDSGEVG